MRPARDSGLVVTVDIGRSTTRARFGAAAPARRDQGAALRRAGGVEAVAGLVHRVVAEAPTAPWRLAVAVPGALTFPDAARGLARRLGLGWSRSPELVLVASDVAAWHAGAFAGRDGVVLAVGTGAVALGVRGRTARRADGRGPLVGDEGGGAWIGLAGLRAAARALDGLGPATGLTGLSVPAADDELPGPAALAALAPAVLAAARDGDPVAVAILDAAADALATTANAACSGVQLPRDAATGRGAGSTGGSAGGEGSAQAPAAADVPVAVVGGLAAELLPRLRRRHPEIVWAAPVGDALDGLAWLLDHHVPALEPNLVRHWPEPDGAGSTEHGTAAAEPGTEQTTEGASALGTAGPAIGTGSDGATSTGGDGATGTGSAGATRTGSHGAAGPEVDGLPTEAVRPGAEHLDLLPTAELVNLLVAGQAGAVPAVSRAAGAIAEAVEHVAAALRRGGRMVYVGAGTPGRLALQDAAELTPTFGLDPAQVPTLLAGGPAAARAAVEGAEDDMAAGRDAVVSAGIGAGDVVVGVSASGRTPFVRAALAAARERGAVTVAVVCTSNAPLALGASVVIELLTGPEVVAGSTRLAAGTAQKVALNTLSTAAMVRTGATYGGWMVGVRASNAKLRRRAVRIVRDAAGVPEQTAARLVAEAAGDVKTALVSALTGLGVEAARQCLAAAGSVRAATVAAATTPPPTPPPPTPPPPARPTSTTSAEQAEGRAGS